MVFNWKKILRDVINGRYLVIIVIVVVVVDDVGREAEEKVVLRLVDGALGREGPAIKFKYKKMTKS